MKRSPALSLEGIVLTAIVFVVVLAIVMQMAEHYLGLIVVLTLCVIGVRTAWFLTRNW